ncbi:hypothetical protein SAMN05518856_11933 [Paenibacillus sp. OK003]|nr:hypothetical protein SAMN05518856_11933 [Paenibacillus sp. OK003]
MVRRTDSIHRMGQSTIQFKVKANGLHILE